MIRSFSVVLATLAFGCSGNEAPSKPLPKTEPVTGAVTLDDKPLEGASVTFIPTGSTAGIECMGVTDASGKYSPKQLRGSEGVPAGSYKVVISRLLKGGKPVAAGEDPGAGGVAVESLPPRYSSTSETKLTATIKEGGGPVDFKLTSQ